MPETKTDSLPLPPTPLKSSEMSDVEDDMPRVGGKIGGVVWVGGTNILEDQKKKPVDILCYRPESFKDMQKQHENLKKGLDSDKRLEIDDGSKVAVGLTMWVTWMSMMLKNSGMDTVFRIFNRTPNTEVNILETWGDTTLEKVQAWVKLLTTYGCNWDIENLRLSGFAVRNSLGNNLLNRVISFVGAEATGPELFISALHQVNFMTAGLVRGLCDKIVNKNLKSFPGENVAKMGEEIMTLIRQIQSSGTTPQDLLFLVSKPYTTGTQETFRSFAQNTYAQVIDGAFTGDHMNIIVKANNFYQNLVQSGDYQPAKSGKKDQDSIIQSMMAKIDERINKLSVAGGKGKTPKGTKSEVTCYKCGKKGHILPKCPDNKDGTSTPRPDIESWRFVKPKDGEPLTKSVKGVTAKWCGKCQKGKGMWHLGDKAHLEAQHKTVKQMQEEESKVEAGHLAIISDDDNDIEELNNSWDQPLEVSFLD